ncbi:MAG: hypothetical protein B6I36_06195 [Desulfobacteraceae bacterium 4572_35.1]|nr:MAG: hypothetical protein B6I36_06195 [Desulfobacteraceae bacterium 4572_35.1]
MGDFFFIVIVVGALIAFFYSKNRGDETNCSATNCAEEPVAEEPVAEEPVAEEPVAEESELNALAWRVLHRVMENPGILQTEMYKLFPRENRKHLQTTLLQLDKDKVLLREKDGNTYRLFPI